MRCTGSWLPPRAGMRPHGSGRLPGGASNCRAGQSGGARGHQGDRAGAGVLAAGWARGTDEAEACGRAAVVNAAAACRERRHSV